MASAPNQTLEQKILEKIYIKKFKLTLSSKKDIKIVHLLRNGIMRIRENETLYLN